MDYLSLIDPDWVRHQITMARGMTPTLVANQILQDRNIRTPALKQVILEQVKHLVEEQGWRYEGVNNPDFIAHLNEVRRGAKRVDPSFVESALVEVLYESMGGDVDDEYSQNPKSLKTALGASKELGRLKSVDAFVTAQDVNLKVNNGIENLSDEELMQMAASIQKRLPAVG